MTRAVAGDPSEIDFSKLSPAALAQVVSDMEAMVALKTHRKIEVFDPYPKQLEFFELGATCRERMLRAGNQLGKSEAGAYETALHLTGLYPKWWKGVRFHKPIRAWLGGESASSVRDIQQNKLCGRPGVVAEFGTGLIPKHLFIGQPSASHGATGGFDTMLVQHHTEGVPDGVSSASFKTYEQGREKWQGEPIDWEWLDEEPPPEADIYSEAQARLLATMGSSIVTYTPLKGRTPLVSRFDRETGPSRGMVKISIWDTMGYLPHLATKEMVEAVIASFPAHQREARAYGEPVLGSGAIFSVPEDQIKFDPGSLPLLSQYFKLWGIDFGINHPFSAVLIAWDKDADIIYVLDGFKVADQTKLQHVPRMRGIAAEVPVAWPHDGHSRDKGSGEELAEQYKKPLPGMPGLRMLPDHAQFEEGGYSTEAGVQELISRLETGRLKVSFRLTEWFEEYRDYHREKGLIVKLNDDLLSATRIAVMDRRNAKLASLGQGRPPGRFELPPQRSSVWDAFTGEVIDTGPRPLVYRGSTPPNPFEVN